MAAAREGEPDRYLAALLAPRPHREALLALAAFSAEIRRIPQLVHEPAMGEIRRQWWRDALALPEGLRSGHPVADAARAASRSYHLPAALLVGFIDAASRYPGSGSLFSDEQLQAHLWSSEGALFGLAAQVLGVPTGADTTAGCADAGFAYGLTRLLVDLPPALAAGRVAPSVTPLAGAGSTLEDLGSEAGSAKIKALLSEYAAGIRQRLARAQRFVAGLPRPARAVFLPLALVEPYLRVLERSGARFLQQGASVTPLTRVSRIAAAHLFGRL